MPKFGVTPIPPRILICGEPASGKTGAIAQLANAGFNVYLHDMDRNARIIGAYLKPDHAPIRIQSYEVAKLTDTAIFAGGPSNVGQKAVAELKRFTKMLEHWKEDDFDAGPTSALTPKDVIVVDSGTFLGELLLLAAKEDPETKKDGRSLYNVAGRYYKAILDYLTGNRVGASVIVLTHLMQTGDKDDQGRIIGKAKDIPVAVGEKASKIMTAYFSDVWHLTVDRTGNRQYLTSATDTAGRRTSRPDVIKAVEPFDLGGLLKKLTG